MTKTVSIIRVVPKRDRYRIRGQLRRKGTAMKIESLSPGKIVFNVIRQKAGNTTVRTTAIYEIRIVSIDMQTRTVIASWNSNREREYPERHWSKWRLNRPVLIKSGFGHRLATREEIKALKSHEK